MADEFSVTQAQAAHCWFDIDRVPHDPTTTSWKRRARWHQACWREELGFPMGSAPYAGGPDSTPVGSRLALEFAKSSGANFLSPAVHEAVRWRLANPERGQTLLADRLWADLLSSMPLCFNLFGELAADPKRAAEAIEAWWPDVPRGTVSAPTTVERSTTFSSRRRRLSARLRHAVLSRPSALGGTTRPETKAAS